MIKMSMSQQKLKVNDYYTTSDLALASLISLYHPLEAINRSNSNKAEFLFLRNTQLDQLVELYWRKELKVEPQTYFNQIKAIKSRLYGG